MTLPNELHPGFFSAAGGGDVGDPIDQSLRFKGSTLDFQYTPSTTGSRQTWTWATWVKRTNMTGTHGLLGVSAGASDSQQTEIRIESTGMLVLRGYTTTFRQTKMRFRDPTAWYHIVVVCDITNSTANDRIRFFINGQKVTDWDVINNPGTSDIFAINYADNTRLGLRAGGTDRLDGYLAETYFIDGTAISDTNGVIDEFGRYNKDGVWVPKTYTGSFGPNNGYHLKYDISGYNGSGGVGADHSGSGNDFTATNFDLTPKRDPGWESYAASWGTSYTNQPSAIFSGEATANYRPWDWYFLSPSTAQIGGIFTEYGVNQGDVLKFDVYPRTGSVYLDMNSGAVTNTVSGNALSTFSITVPSGGLSTLTIRGDDATYWGIGAMYVNNVMLINGGGFIYDSMQDSPTKNYTTGNSIQANAYTMTAITNANLTWPQVATSQRATTIPINDGKWYFEYMIESESPGNTYPQFKLQGIDWYYQDSIAIGGTEYYDYTEASPAWKSYPASMQASGTRTQRVQYDSSTGTIIITNPSGTTWTHVWNGGAPGGTYADGTGYPAAVAFAVTNTVPGISVNFGQQPFVYTIPEGYKPLHSNNLSEPTIKKGKKHHSVLTYTTPGSPSFPVTINGIGGGMAGNGELDFDGKPDMVWFKMTNGASEGVIFDSCRGEGGYLQPRGNHTTTSVSNFAFATNGFTFSSQQEQYYRQNDSYVAWCWKAGGAPTTTNTAAAGAAQDAGSVKVNGGNGSFAHGTIRANKMSVNTTAGFSIVTYTGTGSAGSIPHGLGVVPEWGIFKRYDGTGDWDNYHVAIGNTKIIKFNSTDGQSADGIAYWNNTTPTNEVFTIGAGGANNTLNENYVAYIFASIEGYSKFGSYTAVNKGGSAPSQDCTYVHLGFKPAWLLIKRTNAGGDNWILLDSTRDPQNFCFRAHQVGTTTTPVSSGDQFAIDFLSNGFKCRSSNAAISLDGATYLYCAFAESPFGGENTPPITAR